MLYLPRFSYYIFLLVIAISITSSNVFAIVLISGIFFYLPVSITVWAFSTIYEKIFKAIDSSNDHSTASTSLKLMYLTFAISLLLITIGIVQESTRTAGYGVAAIFFAIEQLIGITERRRVYAGQ
jgi:uncharacterized membrane protein